jgi:phospholipid/cholesterol/gamma-HCH transport system permease protein
MIIALRKQSARVLSMVGEYSLLFLRVAKSIVVKPPSWRLLREQLFHIGVMSFSVVAITGFTTGFVLAAQSFYQLGEKGLAGMTGAMVGKSMIAELGPILTALMVTGRVGASMCAELGTMRVTEQIDALRSMAVHPYSYLVAPRVVAGILMIPLLTLFSVAMGIFGGYLIASSLSQMTLIQYFTPMMRHVSAFDILSCLIKAFVFGILLVTVCCYKGMTTTGGAAGVGKATTQSVVTSYILILVSDFLLTLGLHSLHQHLRYGWIQP